MALDARNAGPQQYGPPSPSQISIYQSYESVAEASAAAQSSSAALASASSAAQSTAATTIPTSVGLDSSSTAKLEGTSTTEATPASTPSIAAASTATSISTSGSSVTSSDVASTTNAGQTSGTLPIANTSTGGSTLSTVPTPFPDSLISTPTPTSLHGSDSTTPTAASATSFASSLPTSFTSTGDRYHHSMSHGAVAAAVVLPILVLVLLAVLLLLLLRRRRRQARRSMPVFQPVMKEKPANGRGVAAGGPPMTAARNNAYMTGLDTSSNGSKSVQNAAGEYYGPHSSGSGAFIEPPPPYKNGSTPRSGASRQSSLLPVPAAAMYSQNPIPQLHEPEDSPFADPPSPHAEDAEGLVVPALQRQQSARSTSNQSITSTLYSSNASMHSALPARMSLGGANVIPGPFDDPSSPISDDDEEFHSLRGSHRMSGESGER